MITFGAALRAARLGYHYYERLKAFVRIDATGPPWRIDICPVGTLLKTAPSTEHVIWWEDKDDPFKLSPAVSRIRKVETPIFIYIDENGELSRPRDKRTKK